MKKYQLTKWAEIIKECKSSGIKVSEWLEQKNISKDQYYYWQRKVKDACLELIYLVIGFTNKLRKGETIQIFNYGNCKRDFIYVDDIEEGVKRVMQAAPEKLNGEDGLPVPPYRVYNIGNNQPENLLDFVDILQQELIRAGVLAKFVEYP